MLVKGAVDKSGVGKKTQWTNQVLVKGAVDKSGAGKGGSGHIRCW